MLKNKKKSKKETLKYLDKWRNCWLCYQQFFWCAGADVWMQRGQSVQNWQILWLFSTHSRKINLIQMLSQWKVWNLSSGWRNLVQELLACLLTSLTSTFKKETLSPQIRGFSRFGLNNFNSRLFFKNNNIKYFLKQQIKPDFDR